MTKRNVMERLLSDPESFDPASIDFLIRPWDGERERIDADDIRAAFFRIFDLNTFTRMGYADDGMLHLANFLSNKCRRRKAFRRLRRKLRKSSSDPVCRIYAEGDSWFQHPLLRDVVDHLRSRLRRKPFVIFNGALGGDWLLNYLKKRHYIEEISLFQPDVVMLSGGGNDIVGGMKLALLLGGEGVLRGGLGTSDQANEQLLRASVIARRLLPVDAITGSAATRLVRGLLHLNREFVAIIWLLEIAYKYLIKSIRKKHKAIRLITHGYDYPVPARFPNKWYRPFRALLNWAFRNGRWMHDPLTLRGITDPATRNDIMFTVIYCFNEMLIRVGRHPVLGRNLFHVDARGTAGKRDGWHDEMHLTSRNFRKVASAFARCIQTPHPEEKVFRVLDP